MMREVIQREESMPSLEPTLRSGGIVTARSAAQRYR